MSGILSGTPFGNMADRIWSPSGELLTVKTAVISASTIGDNTLVSAVSGKSIYVLSLFFICSTAVSVRFESGAGGTALSGVMPFPANGGMVLPFNTGSWFNTASNTLLNMELSVAGSATVAGTLQYVEF